VAEAIGDQLQTRMAAWAGDPEKYAMKAPILRSGLFLLQYLINFPYNI
jgi:hypothetical protein